jgi:ribonuclease T2
MKRGGHAMKRTKSLLLGTFLIWATLNVAGCKTSAGTASPTTSTIAQGSAPSDAVAESSFQPRQRRGGRAEENVAPGTFDFYLLTLSWSPEYCVTHESAAECAAHPAFVLHGLWPENTNGTYPEDCSSAAGPTNPGQYSDIYPDQSLLAHEWKTHGTCSGLAANAYFNAERQALHSVAIPTQLASLKSQISLTPTQIITDFTQANPGIAAGDVVVSCGNNRLTAVEICLTKDLKATSCGAVKTCKATTVKVTPPGATSDQ